MKRHIKRAVEAVVSAVTPLLWSAQREPRLLVLMYHRVLPANHPDRRVEQPGMFVSPETLDMHLSELRRRFELVHLDDWLSLASSGKPLPQRACALTFDDGWLDNYEHAYPVLLRHRAPATIFLVSNLIGTITEFWPNRLGRLLSSGSPDLPLPAALADVLEPAVARARHRGEFGVEEIDLAIRLAKQLGESQLEQLLDEARTLRPDAAPKRAVLNDSELSEMGRSGLVRYGSHTRTHFRCRADADPETLEREIGVSRVELATRLAQPIDLFCYPNGDHTPAAVSVVGRHYAGAVTTSKGWYRPGADRFRIPRIGVHEDISSRRASFLARISGLV